MKWWNHNAPFGILEEFFMEVEKEAKVEGGLVGGLSMFRMYMGGWYKYYLFWKDQNTHEIRKKLWENQRHEAHPDEPLSNHLSHSTGYNTAAKRTTAGEQ